MDPTEFAGVVASSTFGVGREASNAIDGYKQVIIFPKKVIIWNKYFEGKKVDCVLIFNIADRRRRADEILVTKDERGGAVLAAGSLPVRQMCVFST